MARPGVTAVCVCGASIDPGAAETGGAVACPCGRRVPVVSSEARVPERLGPYRVLGRLGEGGMGVVFRGHDETLDRPVALKVLTRAPGPDGASSELEREARAIAAITHPNVVAVYAAGEQDGLVWFAMELVVGPDLAEVLAREGVLDSERARRYLRQAASGLRAAARKGIFHRDVKPANLLVQTGEDRIKVADFGLARRACVEGSLAGTSLVAGTPLYVAPEVIRDGAGDERSDIYSLGATFHHLLAGEPPFGARSAADALVGHALEPAPDLGAVRPDVAPDLARVVARCLEKDPGARFQSYDELLAALEGERPPAAPPAAQVAAPVARAVPPPAIPIVVRPVSPRKRRRWPLWALVLVPLLVARYGRTLLSIARVDSRGSSARDRDEPLANRTRSTTVVVDRDRCDFDALACQVRAARVPADLLCPKTVWEARRSNPGPASLDPTTCRVSGLPHAVCGNNSPVIAWHVHDVQARVVLYAGRDGRAQRLALVDFLRYLRTISHRRGTSWPAVVLNLRPFLPEDVDAELSVVERE